MAPVDKTKTKRRAGYVFLGAATLYLFIPMMFGAFGGASRGELWDPFTGQAYTNPKESCLADAERLIKEAGQLEKRTPAWEDPYRNWVALCATGHADLHQVLMNARKKLRAPVPVSEKK